MGIKLVLGAQDIRVKRPEVNVVLQAKALATDITSNVLQPFLVVRATTQAHTQW